jgi:hypothetical protein
MPYGQVNATLARILGLHQSVHSLERTHRRLAEEVAAFWEAQPVPPAEQEEQLLVWPMAKGCRCAGMPRGPDRKGPERAKA